MFKTLHEIIKSLHPLFSYQKTYSCFVLVLLGFILQMDHNGVSDCSLVGVSGKPSRFWGHNFGSTALLVGSDENFFAVPCLATTHEGVKHFYSHHKSPSNDSQTLVTRMIDLLAFTACKLGYPVYAVVNAYFCTGPAFRCAQQ